MATYILISSNVLSSSAASVTFSSIPATYTDLVLRASVRTDGSNFTSLFGMTLNADATALYSVTVLQGDGTSATSLAATAGTYLRAYNYVGASATANTFSNVEFYIPNYTSTTSKPISSFGVSETNSATDAKMQAVAGLYRNTTAITSLTLDVKFASNFVSGSSFYLYGISNA
jgi:hypothetical protein